MKALLLGFILPLSALANGNGGDLVGNAGDSQVIQFRNLALGMAEKLQDVNASCRTLVPFRVLDLIRTVYRAHIKSTNDDLTLNGNHVEAINYPALQQIIFNSPAFDRNQNKPQFVLHEFLGLLGISDVRDGSEYGQSNFLLGLANRPECLSPVSARRWTKKTIDGDLAYFLFQFPGSVLTYDLARNSQAETLPAPDSSASFELAAGTPYFSYPQNICTAGTAPSCLTGGKVPWLLHDFGRIGDHWIESIQGVRDTDNVFETYYSYDNVQVVNPTNGNMFSFQLLPLEDNQNLSPGEKYHYSLPRDFVRLTKNQTIAIVDQYSGDALSSFSIARFDLRQADGPGHVTETMTRADGTFLQRVQHGNDDLVVFQRFWFPSAASVPQNIFTAQSGKFALLDDGNVIDPETLESVAVIEAPIEDVGSYGDYTIVLSAGRILVYDSDWHQQGEFNPAVRPAGLAVRGDEITLFSMLTDNRIFVERHDVTDFFKKKRSCLVSQERLAQFIATDTLAIGGQTFALDVADGCILKRDGQAWRAWMGMQKNPAFVIPFMEKGVVVTAEANATLYSLNVLDRDETMIAAFARDLRCAEKKDGSISLTLHKAGFDDNYLEQVILTPDGKILSDQEYWKQFGPK
jgi:hypothetical protein